MFEVTRCHDVSIVGVNGELSSHNIHVLENVFMSLAQCEQNNVVLNFSGLTHLDYKLVRKIVDQIIAFKCDGGDLKMAAVSDYIRYIFQAMGWNENLYTSVEEALISFAGDYRPEVMQ